MDEDVSRGKRRLGVVRVVGIGYADDADARVLFFGTAFGVRLLDGGISPTRKEQERRGREVVPCSRLAAVQDTIESFHVSSIRYVVQHA